jgi:hypothetical protein
LIQAVLSKDTDGGKWSKQQTEVSERGNAWSNFALLKDSTVSVNMQLMSATTGQMREVSSREPSDWTEWVS